MAGSYSLRRLFYPIWTIDPEIWITIRLVLFLYTVFNPDLTEISTLGMSKYWQRIFLAIFFFSFGPIFPILDFGPVVPRV